MLCPGVRIYEEYVRSFKVSDDPTMILTHLEDLGYRVVTSTFDPRCDEVILFKKGASINYVDRIFD